MRPFVLMPASRKNGCQNANRNRSKEFGVSSDILELVLIQITSLKLAISDNWDSEFSVIPTTKFS